MFTENNSRGSNPDQTIDDPKRRRNILYAVCIALMAVIASVTGLNVAQPHLAQALDASQSDVLWMINIYAISLAALLLPLGAVGDRWGRKPIMMLGLAIFGLANIAAGLAPSINIMLIARFFTGIGAAMIMPVTLSVITLVFPDSERSKAIGVWTAVAGGGAILGMFLSALLVDTIGWRWLFALPILLVIISAIIGIRSIPNTTEVAKHEFDLFGSILSIFTVIGLIVFLHEGAEQGWMAAITLSGLAVGLIATIGFILWELHHPAPLLDIRLFGKRSLTSGSVTLITWFGVQAGVFIVLYPFFQAVLGWSGLLATIGLMPMGLLMMASSAFAPKLVAIIGARYTMACGMLLGGIGLALMSIFVSIDGGYLTILPGMVVMGLGMGLAMTPSTEAITSSLPQDRQGVASALNDVTREFGTALGVALLGAVFTTGYTTAIEEHLESLPDEAAEIARKGIAGVLYLEPELPYAATLLRSTQEAFVIGWQQAMWSGVVVLVLLFIYVLLRGPENAKIT